MTIKTPCLRFNIIIETDYELYQAAMKQAAQDSR